MLLASISIIGPALSRIPGVHEFPVRYLVGMLSLFIALPLYDIIRNRRVHPATAWALPFVNLDLDLDLRHSGGNVQRWAIFHPLARVGTTERLQTIAQSAASPVSPDSSAGPALKFACCLRKRFRDEIGMP